MTEKSSKVWMWIFKMALIVYLGFTLDKLMIVNQLQVSDSISSFEVLDKNCKNSRRPSYVTINTPKGSHKMRYLRSQCFEIERGDFVELYHDSDYDFFHIPGNQAYKRASIAVSLLLIGMFLPWDRLLKKVK